MRRAAKLALILACCSPTALRAQSLTLPRFSGELTLGSALRTGRAGETWYKIPAREAYIRFGGSIRIGSPGRVRPVINVDKSSNGNGDQLTICGIAPNGSCYRYFPSTSGLSGSLGVRAIPHSRVVVGTSVGVARYEATTSFAEMDVALGVTRRVFAVAHVRHLTWRGSGDTDGSRLWMRPLTFGIRVQ